MRNEGWTPGSSRGERDGDAACVLYECCVCSASCVLFVWERLYVISYYRSDIEELDIKRKQS